MSWRGLVRLLRHPPDVPNVRSRPGGNAMPDAPAPSKILPATVFRAGRRTASVLLSPQDLGRRFDEWRPAVEVVLQRNNASLPLPVLRDLVRHVVDFIGDGSLANLADARLPALLDSMRMRMLEVGGAVDNLLLREAARRGQIAFTTRAELSLDLLSVPIEGGLWLYVVPSSPQRRHVVLHEAFAPTTASSDMALRRSRLRTPPRPPVPGVASPLWATQSGVLLTQPTSTPITMATSGLPDRTLEIAPGLIFEQLRLAELRGTGSTTRTLTGADVATVGPVPPNVTFGGGIRRIAYRITEGGLHYVYIRGRTIGRLRGERAVRLPYSLLPAPELVFGPQQRMEILHLYPAVFGDTTTVGEAYGPEALNDAMRRLEIWLQSNGGIRRAEIDVEVSAIIEMRPGPRDGVPYPHLRRASYSWTDEGQPTTFSAGIDDETGEVYIMERLGEGRNLLPEFPRRTR